MEKICLRCGKKFTGRKTAKYCSRACCDESLAEMKLNKRIKFICKWCGKEFHKRGTKEKKFCSKKCYGEYIKSQKKIRSCIVCGKEFEVERLSNGRFSEAKTCSNECRLKLSELTCFDKFGVSNASKSETIQHKKDKTKQINKTTNTSKPEDYIFLLLSEKFKCIKRQHKTIEYPFNCDFYIPELSLYIEYQGTWTHGGHPFDKNNIDDIDKLNGWKIKSEHSKYFKSAIDTWTIKDPLKRRFAHDNNLNWIEFFDISSFTEWYKKLFHI